MPQLPSLLIPERAPPPPVLDRTTEGQAKHWGWVIYRTVYDPESDEKWDQVVKRLDELIISDFEAENASQDPGRRNMAREKYRNTILQDKEKFENAPIEILEQHFEEWAPTAAKYEGEEYYSATWKAFLVVDANAMDAILRIPTTKEDELAEAGGDPSTYAITVAEKIPKADNYEYDYENEEEHWLDEEEEDYDVVAPARSWPGHFQVSIYRLYGFWIALRGESMSMEVYVLFSLWNIPSKVTLTFIFSLWRTLQTRDSSVWLDS
jgi:hypothetical protein